MSGFEPGSGAATCPGLGFHRWPPLRIPSLAPADGSLADRSVAAQSSPLGIPSLPLGRPLRVRQQLFATLLPAQQPRSSERAARMRQWRPLKRPIQRKTCVFSIRKALVVQRRRARGPLVRSLQS